MSGKIILEITRPFKPKVTRFEMDEGRVSVGPAFFGKDSVEVVAQYDAEQDTTCYWIRYHAATPGRRPLTHEDCQRRDHRKSRRINIRSSQLALHK